MGSKRILVVVLATAALFGAVVAGCNRDGETRVASAAGGRSSVRGRRQARRGGDAGSAVRPAEVMSGLAHRAPVRNAADRRSVRDMRQAQRPPAYPSQQQYAAAYSAQTASISEPYTIQPSRTNPSQYEKVYERGVVQPMPVPVSPALAVARAQLRDFVAPLSDVVPTPTPESFPVPIPELEPIRYARAAGERIPDIFPVATVPSAPAASESRPHIRGWVASPTTAMRQ